MASEGEELERRWYARLTNARLRLEVAMDYVPEVQRDLEAKGLAATDITLAESLRDTALDEYRRILRIYAALVLDGKIPDADHESASDRGYRPR